MRLPATGAVSGAANAAVAPAAAAAAIAITKPGATAEEIKKAATDAANDAAITALRVGAPNATVSDQMNAATAIGDAIDAAAVNATHNLGFPTARLIQVQ